MIRSAHLWPLRIGPFRRMLGMTASLTEPTLSGLIAAAASAGSGTLDEQGLQLLACINSQEPTTIGHESPFQGQVGIAKQR
jgi:hypothetical protein